MTSRSFELREFFHLAFLQHLSGRISGHPWAVKGGTCLRFFHRSQRLSQDMDIDVVPQIERHTLRTAVDTLLAAKAFRSALLSQGITRIHATKPKQTDTVQRWKVALYLGETHPLPAKVEFSRRQTEILWSSGIPDSGLLGRYAMAPFAARFYGAPSMASQKIHALASPSRFAVRDLFDLHHLFRVVEVKPADLAGMLTSETIEHAAEKIDRFTYRDFREQVLPYLTGTLIDAFGDPEAFEKLKLDVERILSGMI